MARFTGLTPVLLAPDVKEALDYHREVVGFEVEPYGEAPFAYGYARRDGTHIHIAHADHCRPNSDLVSDLFDVYVWVDDVGAVHHELTDCGAHHLHGPTDREYGLREILIEGETFVHYVNIGRVVSLQPDEIVWDDYAPIDVLRWPDGRVEVVDENEVPRAAGADIAAFIAAARARLLRDLESLVADVERETSMHEDTYVGSKEA